LFLQTSLEYTSLLTGLGTAMPDVEEEDEADARRRPLPVAALVTIFTHLQG
jgi:hypothetical protein